MDPVDPVVRTEHAAQDTVRPTWLVLTRYLIGEASPNEAASVERWAATHAGGSATLTALRRWWTPRPQPVDARHVEDALSAVLQRATIEKVSSSAPQPFAPHPDQPTAASTSVKIPAASRTARAQSAGGWYTLAGAMAGAIAVIIGGALVHRGMVRSGTRVESSYTTYATTNAQQATITLPDGNAVTLDVASRLEVPTNYGTGNHTVRLAAGEALFTVSHHAARAFTVVVGGETVRVLGTSFVVRHYATDTTTVVSVRTGKVGVRSVVLTAAQQVAIGPRGVEVVRPADPAQFSFATGVLAFKGVSLADAVPQLDRWYNADIRLGDPALGRQHLTGEYAAGSLADLTSILELTFNVHVVRNGRVLTLYPR